MLRYLSQRVTQARLYNVYLVPMEKCSGYADVHRAETNDVRTRRKRMSQYRNAILPFKKRFALNGFLGNFCRNDDDRAT